MSQTILKAGTPENPYSKDVKIVHAPDPTRYFCQSCDATFTKRDKAEAREMYLKHQMKVHKIKHPLIHSFEQDEADEYWTQNYL